MSIRNIIAAIAFVLPLAEMSGQSLRFLVDRPENIIESKWEELPSGEMQLNYYNSDYCDYILYRTNDKSYNLRPGKTTVFTLKKGETSNPFKQPGSYTFYRGRFVNKFNPAFVYAMPVKNGVSVEYSRDQREAMRTMKFSVGYRDTVYAVRRGIVCRTGYKGGIIACHDDGSFAGYLNMVELFRTPGEEIMVGEPIGLAGHSGVSLSVFFLDRNLLSESRIRYPYTFIAPYFRTSAGDIRLEENESYEAVVDDALVTAEMSKSEIKKYYRKK